MKKSLVIVAHPDDETIWMGGTILKNPKWNWTIISLCRKDDKDRAPKFRKVCKHYKAKPIMANLDDKKLKPVEIKKISSLIKKILQKTNYDCVFTHGSNGEYGHLRHKEIHQAVKALVKDELIRCKEIYFFSYKKGRRKIPTHSENSDLVTTLSQKKLKEKIDIVCNLYGFDKNSFEVMSCNKKETFKRGK